MENTKINVERETFKSNGKEYFSYFIKGVVRGRNVKAGPARQRRLCRSGYRLRRRNGSRARR